MSEAKVVITATLKEGYWVRIGDDSYAVHQILSVSVTELLPPDGDDASSNWAFAGIGLGFCAGVLTSSWVVGLVLGLLLFFGVIFYFTIRQEREEKSRRFLRNVTIELVQKGPRLVAEAIPKENAERLQMEIESIVAGAARSEAEKAKPNNTVPTESDKPLS